MGAGRYAPSPTGDLHVGNLRTALLAWAAARSTGRDFYLRLEDLDRGRARDPAPQIRDLREIGLDWDGPIVVQSERLELYEAAMNELSHKGLVFECFCSRRDIREAASASHTPPGQYPGTCLSLGDAERRRMRGAMAQRGLKPALRLAPRVATWTVNDMYYGNYTGAVDAVVLQRGDGEFAYNLAVVVDDVAMGVDQIVRGDDLLASSPVHSYLTSELGGTEPTYGHVPLVLGPSGARLAKRDGAVTLEQLKSGGYTISDVLDMMMKSLGAGNAQSVQDFLAEFARLKTPFPSWTFLY